MFGRAYLLLVEDRAQKFLLGLSPKQYKQVAARIFLLSRNPRPTDSTILKGHADLRRIDQGEFRVVYAVNEATGVVIVRRAGKRNDDEVYRGL